MSGSTIGGVVGAVVGFVASGYNPQGAQIGWAIGSAIGGYVDPVKVEGPRLKDAMRQTSQDGVPIPFGYGTFPTAGNLIWTAELKEVKKKERQGKGGPVVTSYAYTRSYAIGISEGEIAGLLMVKRNGKVVYDARDQTAVTEWMQTGGTATVYDFMRRTAALNSRWTSQVAFYSGSEIQLPDPTIEAVEGVGNVPAHRGLAYMVVTDEDLTETQGAVPQYEFVVADCGTVKAGQSLVPRSWFASGSQSGGSNGFQSASSGIGWLDNTLESGSTSPNNLIANATRLLSYNGTAMIYSDDRGLTFTAVADPPNSSGDGFKGRYINGTFHVPCGVSGMARSADGATWVEGVAADAASLHYHAVAGKTGVLVAGGLYGRIRTSSDGGVTFTPVYTVALPLDRNIYAICEGDGVFVAGGELGSMASSSDGTTWAAISSPLTGTVWRIENSINPATSTRLWGAVTTNGQFAYSSTGLIWTVGPTTGFTVRDMHTQDGLFVAVGEGGKISTWQLGDPAWTARANYFGTGTIYAVTSLQASGIPIPDAPGYSVDASGTVYGPGGNVIDLCHPLLSAIVADLCGRAGLTAADYDVSGLTDAVDGYKVAIEAGADAMISPLMPAYFFDAAEYDGKIRFRKRGGPTQYSVGPNDLAERDAEAVSWERVQEAELLRKVTVGYIDPMTQYSVTTQTWERRSATVNARGESATELPVVMSAMAASRVAEMRGKVAWSETEKATFALPAIPWARVTPTDVLALYAPDGSFERVRINNVEEDSGVLHVEVSRDSQSAYTGTAGGVLPPPPRIVQPPLIGPTVLALMDLPAISEDHDRLGIYVAAGGLLSGWRGGEVLLSTDAGLTYEPYAQVVDGSNIGATTTPLAPWANAEAACQQTLTVRLPFAPESVTRETLQRYRNRAALRLDDGTWEVLQYTSVTANTDGTYTLSGLVRGRYATTPGAAAIGAQFVVLDSTVQFVPAEAWALNTSLMAKAVSYGTDRDAVTGTAVAFGGKSATEFAPHHVRASRDGSNNVTVTWIARGRIGAETVARQSQWFTGYRVTFSNGHTADVTAPTYTYLSAPAGVTASVRAINSITGAGPASEVVTA